ncbi:hypothetical protein M0R72_17525 [Candidatus Pacearchaeota archaeon]|jgi:hypothetical protein|nr:hypothetical protein [Candidatus Pacearchaeota archaeon]
MSKDQPIDNELEERVKRLERVVDLMQKNLEPFSYVLERVIGKTWKCCSCGKERFFAIEKPAKEQKVNDGFWTWWKYLCDECSKAFGVGG